VTAGILPVGKLVIEPRSEPSRRIRQAVALIGSGLPEKVCAKSAISAKSPLIFCRSLAVYYRFFIFFVSVVFDGRQRVEVSCALISQERKRKPVQKCAN
jgi:hypothetical protein